MTNKDNDTPLHYAADEGHTRICKLLLEKGADVNQVITDAVAFGSRWLTPLEFLLENGAYQISDNKWGEDRRCFTWQPNGVKPK